MWVAKVCRHPLLSQSLTWKHFLTCTDEKVWKQVRSSAHCASVNSQTQGKRRAEKDDFCGGNFFLSVKTPDRKLPEQEV